MYFVALTENKNDKPSADVVFEDEEGFIFICDCGDYDNENARNNAEKICRLLNKDLEEKKCQ